MQSTNQDQQQFRTIAQQLNASWDGAFNAQQAEQVATFYDAAATVMPSGAAQVSGVTDILQFWSNLLAQGVIDHHIEMLETAVDAILAVQRGKWSAAAVDANGQRQTFGGALLLTYRRQADGSWKILNHIWNM
ncbi:MAG TPA: nuclear transport factor 2 family protein [Methylophilaceae bacterium]|nr:nuclear transport factor 2 family protein [Methylophilaceae bacterium]